MGLMKIGIFLADSNGGYPVPASRGGAVSTLVEHLVRENNNQQIVDMDIISIYDSGAEKMSKSYPNVNFLWIKPPIIFKFMDKIFFDVFRTLFKKKKSVSYKSLFSLIYCILASSKIIRKNNYDKVILENNIPLAWCIKLSRYKGDYYYHLHNVPRINAKCNEVFQNCNAILCVSGYVGEQITSEQNPIGPIPTEKIRVLYNCIDVEQFKPLEDKAKKEVIRSQYGILADEKVVSFVGRLSEEKGIDKVLEAVMSLKRDDIKVLVVGSLIHNATVVDEYQKKLYKLAEALENQIIFTGYIPQAEVQKIYQISDVAVLPSMWDEPAGLTMVEAMACGTPVITTNAGGIPEYMHGNAVILERNSELTKNISCAIEQLLTENRCFDFECIDTKEYYHNFYKCIQS